MKIDYVNLERGLVKIWGSDSAKLLQGLATNDVYKLGSGEAQYSAFLNHKGRVLFDFFLYKSLWNENEYFIESQKPYAEDINVHLLMYRLKYQVQIEMVTDQYKIYGSTSANAVEGRNLIKIADKRCDWSFWRTIVPNSEEIVLNGLEGNRSQYRTLRCINGIPEGYRELKWFSAIPHEYNLDLMGAISFNKGCYIGQELVSRVEHKGIVRKRVMPLRLYTPLLEDDKEWKLNVDFDTQGLESDAAGLATRIRDEFGTKKHGTKYDVQANLRGLNVFRVEGNCGLGLVKLDVWKSFPKFMVFNEGKAEFLMAEPFIPKWWPTSVLQTIEAFPNIQVDPSQASDKEINKDD